MMDTDYRNALRKVIDKQRTKWSEKNSFHTGYRTALNHIEEHLNWWETENPDPALNPDVTKDVA